jgi:phosphomannomutase
MEGGVVVTASHNPPQFNGFKVVGKQAYPIGGDDIQDLLKVTLDGILLKEREITNKKVLLTSISILLLAKFN